MPEMEPELMEFYRQEYEDGVLTCPTCGSAVEVNADKCKKCGWKNWFKPFGTKKK